MPSRRASAHAFLAVSVLALAACGQATGAAEDGGSEVISASPTATETWTPAALPPVGGSDDLQFQPWSGTIPLWPLTAEEEQRLRNAWIGVPDGYPLDCWGEDPLPEEECYGLFLASYSVSADAFRFLRETHFAANKIQGKGQVKVLVGFEGGSYTPPDYAIVTPKGLISQTALMKWTPYLEAVRVAMQQVTDSPVLRYLRGYSASFSLVHFFGSPKPTDAGWTVMSMVCWTGMSNCSHGDPVDARIAIGFTNEGLPVGARFVDICSYPVAETTWGEAARAGAVVYAQIPHCEGAEP